MGGGTGRVLPLLLAPQARDRGILTVRIVTKPFMFEAVSPHEGLAAAGDREFSMPVSIR